MPTLLSLPLELREQIYESFIFATDEAPLLNKRGLRNLHFRAGFAARWLPMFTPECWRVFDNSIEELFPASTILQLCCRQIHDEVHRLLCRLRNSLNITYELDLKFCTKYAFPQVTWTSIPTPVKHLRRVIVHLSADERSFKTGNGGVTHDFYVLIHLLANFLQAGPSFRKNDLKRAQVPFLDEIVVNFTPPDVPPERFDNRNFNHFGMIVYWFLSSGVMHGLLGRTVVVLSSDAASAAERCIEITGYEPPEEARRHVRVWQERQLPGDWIETQRAAYARNKRENERLRIDKYPTSDVWEDEQSEAAA